MCGTIASEVCTIHLVVTDRAHQSVKKHGIVRSITTSRELDSLITIIAERMVTHDISLVCGIATTDDGIYRLLMHLHDV